MIFNKDNFVQHVQAILQEELPGRPAQLKMSSRLPSYRKEYKIPDNVRVAGVLVHLYYDHEWKLTLMERTNRGPHSGQISFPGGGVEEQDDSLIATALREANEEVGIIPEQVEILGKLSTLYIPVSNSLVHPFVGYSPEPPNYVLDPNEVQTVIEARFIDFFDPEKRSQQDITIANGYRLKEIPGFDINGHTVWGATAMMMSEFITAIQAFYGVNS